MDTTKQYCKVLKGLKPATVVEPNNQEDIAIGGLHPHLYTASQYALQAQKGRSWRVAYIYMYRKGAHTYIYIYTYEMNQVSLTLPTPLLCPGFRFFGQYRRKVTQVGESWATHRPR